MKRVLVWMLLCLAYYSRAVPLGGTSDDDTENTSSSAQSASPENFDCEGGYVQGAKWIADYDTCLECSCINRTIDCRLAPTCCKVDSRSKPYHHGELVHEGCATCVCHNGAISCPSRSCSEKSIRLCHAPLPPRSTTCPDPHCVEECQCPRLHCYRGCVVGERKYAPFEEWIDNKCGRSCRCILGTIICTETNITCPIVHKFGCPNGGREVTLPGECCPSWICNDEEPCAMTSWTSWTQCDRTCGLGVSTRRREVKSPPTTTTPAAGSGEASIKCPRTFEVRNCYVRLCHAPHDRASGGGSDAGDNNDVGDREVESLPMTSAPETMEWPWINDLDFFVRLKDNGCRSAHKVKTKLCGHGGCRKYGLRNLPIYHNTTTIEMVCHGEKTSNGTMLPPTRQTRLFARTASCGCLPLSSGYP